jgi:hypothetical protein
VNDAKSIEATGGGCPAPMTDLSAMAFRSLTTSPRVLAEITTEMAREATIRQLSRFAA